MTPTPISPKQGQRRATSSGNCPTDIKPAVSSSKVQEPGDECDDVSTKYVSETCSKVATDHQGPILKLGRYCSKVATEVGYTEANAVEVLSVLDTRISPNLIYQDAVPGLRITPLTPAHKSV